MVNNSPASTGDGGLIPGFGNLPSPLEKGMQPAPGFLPGDVYGQKSLVGYRPRGHKELDTTESLPLNTFLFLTLSFWAGVRKSAFITSSPKMLGFEEQGFVVKRRTQMCVQR